MAKFLEKYQEAALAILRSNIAALRTGKSDAALGEAAGAPPKQAKKVGRNIANLQHGRNTGRVDQIPTAAKALGVDSWQLWVPYMASLQPEERMELKELVDSFVRGDQGMREALNGTRKSIARGLEISTSARGASAKTRL